MAACCFHLASNISCTLTTICLNFLILCVRRSRAMLRHSDPLTTASCFALLFFGNRWYVLMANRMEKNTMQTHRFNLKSIVETLKKLVGCSSVSVCLCVSGRLERLFVLLRSAPAPAPPGACSAPCPVFGASRLWECVCLRSTHVRCSLWCFPRENTTCHC